LTTSDPFEDLIAALADATDASESAGVRIDTTRRRRTGAPEVIYGKGKTPEQIVAAIRRLLPAEGRALAARIEPEHAVDVEAAFQGEAISVDYDGVSKCLLAKLPDREPPASCGRVGIITAGSSDRTQAGEAAAVLREMGCDSRTVHDVGVAGLHRLVQPLRQIVAFDPDALIVAAGMDGVLPGVVSGLVALPIVALPTSTGYGFGGEGLGAMTTMLQACAPGIAVVNIDNGIGAGIMAGLIANRAASQRSS
jgi:NCAIR mutase (PurE)-related protein